MSASLPELVAHRFIRTTHSTTADNVAVFSSGVAGEVNTTRKYPAYLSDSCLRSFCSCVFALDVRGRIHWNEQCGGTCRPVVIWSRR